MDEHRTAELQRFTTVISDPSIRPLIDLQKLYQSGIYNLAVQMATEHAIKHGDFGYLQKILTVLDGSSYANGFIASLRSRVNFIVTDTKPRKFKKATPEQVAKAERRTQNKQVAVTAPTPFKPITKRAAKKMLKSTATAKPTKKKAKSQKVSHDIMDSRLILPGSYGTGRRR